MENNSPFLIYLGGPIKGLSYDESTDWRLQAARHFSNEYIDVLSPMRGKEFLAGIEKLGDSDESHPLTSQRGIVARDKNDVMRCDLVLFNLLNSPAVSIGTMVEFGWASVYQKPIVTVMRADNVHNHPFVRELSWHITTNFNDALEICLSILSSGT